MFLSGVEEDRSISNLFALPIGRDGVIYCQDYKRTLKSRCG